MEAYSTFRPTQFDHHYTIDGRENWLLAPVATNRDADVLTRANWRAFITLLNCEESESTYEIHRFGHWGPGWFEIIIINPNNETLVKVGEDAESSLADYPILDEMLFSGMEQEEAREVWEHCYNDRDRLEYIRKNKDYFYFADFVDILDNVRGKTFSGEASLLIR